MNYIFLDLDGTITDSREGITNCFEYALNHFGIKVENKAELEQFIGPPLEQSFREGFGFDAEKAALAVAKYRERFIPIGMYENLVYPGMEAALQKMKAAGKVLMVATSKPEHMAIKILKHFGLDGVYLIERTWGNSEAASAEFIGDKTFSVGNFFSFAENHAGFFIVYIYHNR